MTEICSSGEVKCPYCFYEDDYTGDALGDEETTEVTCQNCGKTFIIRASVSVEHYCETMEDEE